MIIDMQKAIKNKTAHPDDTPTDVKIAIKDLNLYYGAFHALHGINLDIERGKITAFIGPSGRSEERRVGKECRSRWSPYH